MSRHRIRTIASTGVKVLVSVGLIALVLRGVDSAAVVEQLRNASPASIAFAVLLTTGIALLHAQRWRIVLRAMGHTLEFPPLLRLVLIGYFFNQTLPSTIGGDAYRVWGAYKQHVSAGTAVVSVLVDRILALFALVLMILAGLWWLTGLLRSPAATWIIALVIVAAFVGMGVLIGIGRFREPLQRWHFTRLIVQMSDAARNVVSRPPAAATVVLLTVAGYSCFSFAVYILAAGMQVDLGFWQSLLLIPLVTLVALLPISIAGWGLRESAMVVALGLVGVPAVQAFSLSVLSGLVVMASGIPGGMLWLAGRKHAPPAMAAPGARD
jgi:uncharacterized protein (TIRG00374 family)